MMVVVVVKCVSVEMPRQEATTAFHLKANKSQDMVTYKNPSEISCWMEGVESTDAALSAPFSFR
jgi:hypothetical protein